MQDRMHGLSSKPVCSQLIVVLISHGYHIRKNTRQFSLHFEMIKGPMKLVAMIDIKNAIGLSKWPDLWHRTKASIKNEIPTSAQKNTINSSNTNNVSSTLPSKSQEKKDKDRQNRSIYGMEQVIDNSKNHIASFQATTKLLQRMDVQLVALVQKL